MSAFSPVAKESQSFSRFLGGDSIQGKVHVLRRLGHERFTGAFFHMDMGGGSPPPGVGLSLQGDVEGGIIGNGFNPAMDAKP